MYIKRILLLCGFAVMFESMAFMVQAQSGEEKMAVALEQTARRQKEKAQIFDKTNLRLKQIFYASPRRINWNEKLNLDKEQKRHLKEIYTADQGKVEDLVNQIEAHMQQLQQIYDQEDMQIKQILNENQRTKFEKVQRRMQINKGEKWIGDKPSRKRMK